MNVYKLLETAALKWPSNYAIHEDNFSITFSELWNQTEVLRKQLILAGIGKGHGVGVMAHNSTNFISALFAVVGCDAIAMPISHQLKSAEIDDIVENAGLHAIIDDYSGVNPLPQYQQIFTTPSSDLRFGWTKKVASKAIAAHVPDAAFIRFTSGTTGKSKGVIVSHKSTLERIEAANKALLLGPGDTVIWVLPMAYHFLVSIVLYLRFGAAIAICKDFLADTIIEYTQRFNGTLLYASPMHIRLLASDKSIRQLTSLKRVISTSTAISLQFCEAFKTRYNKEVSQAYGIIEIGLPIVNITKSAQNPDAVGNALPDYQVEMLDENFEPLPPETVGKLAIKGPGMFDAYLNPPQLRSEILKKGWFLTGDLAIKNRDGLITVCGREKSMINVSGNKVFPEEVEQVLKTHAAIVDCKVSGVMHPLMGEIVHAKILLKEGAKVEQEAILDFCRKQLSSFKVPQSIAFVDQLDMTGSGKVKRT